MLLVVFYARELLPKQYINYWESTIHCFNGASYPAGPNRIYAIGGSLDEDADAKARKLCAYNLVGDYANPVITPPRINYRLIPKQVERGGYGEAAQAFLLGLVAVIFLGELLRRTYLYIIAGIPFFSGLSFEGLRSVRARTIWRKTRIIASWYLMIGGASMALHVVVEPNTPSLFAHLLTISFMVFLAYGGFCWRRRLIKKKPDLSTENSPS